MILLIEYPLRTSVGGLPASDNTRRITLDEFFFPEHNLGALTIKRGFQSLTGIDTSYPSKVVHDDPGGGRHLFHAGKNCSGRACVERAPNLYFDSALRNSGPNVRDQVVDQTLVLLGRL